MRQALKPHPDSCCSAATRIEAYVSRGRTGNLLLHYYLTGIGDVLVPRGWSRTRADELWRHTCFEAFVGAPPTEDYYEFNFAPSTQWAAYRFSNYRRGMAVASEIGTPSIELKSSVESFELRAHLKLDGLPSGEAWRLGLSAVIEETNGRISYWALAHPPGKVDFHHADCFALELPAPSRP
ncbi:MAG: DOMON-like domain-containing protein [Alphaproteobacteria bacterium]|nr:DOMON-like domain-containing protein [Alphaproteobacteria bacterium]